MSDLTLFSAVHESVHDGVRRARESRAGEATHDLIVANYSTVNSTPEPAELTAYLQQQPEQTQVTLLVTGRSLVASLLVAKPGRLFNGGTALLPKGKRTSGIRIPSDRLVDVVPGFDTGTLRERVQRAQRSVPQLDELTREHLLALPDRGSVCSLAVYGTYGRVPGCLWLLHSYLREDDIAEGVLIVPPNGSLSSEYGSVFGNDLLSKHVGVLSDTCPLTFKQALDLSRDDAARAVEAVRAPQPV